MRIHSPHPTLRTLILGLAVTTLAVYVARAHPYASGLTNSVPNSSSGTISFLLNENADNVTVVYDSGGTGNTNNLGALTRGVQSFPLSGHTSYRIIVNKVGSGSPSLISPLKTADPNVAFFGPRGVAVNINPKGRNFGRIYVANANPGVDQRQVYKGIYVVNADFTDCLGQGTNNWPPQANFPGGGTQWWGSSTTYAPYRPWIGTDDTVYVGDSSGVGTGVTAGCPVWMMDPDLTTPVEMFAYSGAVNGNSGNAGPCQSRPAITGSLGTGDLVLTCLMWNYQAGGGNYQSLLRYNIGAGPINSSTVWTGLPTIVVTNTQPALGGVNGVTEEVLLNPTNSYVYVVYNRAVQAFPLSGGGITNGQCQVWVFDGSTTTGNTNKLAPEYVWASGGVKPGDGGIIITNYTQDFFQFNGVQPIGCAISPDGQYLGMGNGAAANVVFVKLTNGIPDVSTMIKATASNSTQRGTAFDLADNFYTVEGNSDSLKCYSLGFTTTCITSNDVTTANGSFQLILPPTTVTVAATTPTASTTGPTPGVFTITRSGQTTTALTVNFSYSGTATNGTYLAVSNAVTFAIGQTTSNINITPVVGPARPTTTVVLTLAGGTGYAVGTPASDTVYIQNTATPQLFLATGATIMYKRFPYDYASVVVTRWGDTNVALTANLAYDGSSTATPGTDFTPASAPTVTIPAGALTATAAGFNPLDPSPTYTGNKIIVVKLASGGSAYTFDTATAAMTIVDDAYPATTVLYSNPLTDASDAVNWGLTWANRDQDFVPADYSVNFGYDLTDTDLQSTFGIIPLPPSGATKALQVSFNKTYGAAGGVNLYPTNFTFSGDYAMRFQMYLVQGSTFASATEGPMFGINHNGTETNWWTTGSLMSSTNTYPNGWTSDGVWCWIDSDPAGAVFGDYVLLTGVANTTPNTGFKKLATEVYTDFPNTFKNTNCFTAVRTGGSPSVPGMPSNLSSLATNILGNWADVELQQIQGVVRLTIDKTTIFQYKNTNSLFTSGMIMLGYDDPFSSIGNYDGAVYYSNLRVVRLGPPFITAITLPGGNVQIDFTVTDGTEGTGSFTLQSSASLTPPAFANVSPAATITQVSPGVFRAVTAQSGAVQFYRVSRN